MKFTLRKTLSLLAACTSLLSTTFMGAFELPCLPNTGKVDLAPVYIHMDILEHAHTVDKVDMWGGRLDLSYLFWGGWTVKNSNNAVWGDESSRLYTTSLGLGYTVPLAEGFYITPYAGCGYSYFRVNTKLPAFFNFGDVRFKHTYRTWSPYIAMDVNYTIGCGWRVGATIQYAWANTQTSIGQLVHNQHTKGAGFAYAGYVEKDILENLSINIGVGYNNSLTKEKHGLRAYGAKAGLAYWF